MTIRTVFIDLETNSHTPIRTYVRRSIGLLTFAQNLLTFDEKRLENTNYLISKTDDKRDKK